MTAETRKSIGFALRTKWWVYPIVCVLVCSAWLYAFYLKDRVRDDERIQIFVAGEVKDLSVSEKMHKFLADDDILEVNLYRLDPSFDGFATGFAAQGFLNSDILVLPSSLVERYYANAVVLDDVVSLPDDVSTYSVDGKNYAIRVGIAQKDGFAALYGFGWLADSDEDMYVLLSAQSSNVGSSDSQAIKLLNALLADELRG